MASEINILRVAGDWGKAIRGYKAKMKKWSMAVLEKNNPPLSIVLANDNFVRELNHQYRGKDKATNVLSFNGEVGELGDIVLALETIKHEAATQGKTVAAHTAHLIVHGILHLQGFDHEKEKHAAQMEAKEIAALAKLGFANPYEVRA